MAFDSHKNFSYSLITEAPDPAATGTTLLVRSGDGLLFPPAPFNATVCPQGAIPQMNNAEIVRVTSVVGDRFNILRSQEATTPRSILVGDQIVATVTAKTFTDIETILAAPPGGVEWFPTLTAAGGGLPAYAYRTGNYVQSPVGHVVASFDLKLSSKGSLAGALQLGGLPIAPLAAAFTDVMWDDPGSGTTLVNLMVELTAGNAVGYLRPLLTPTSGAFLSNTLLPAQISNAFRLVGTLVYR
jgi:hypothetical protein